MTGPSGRSRAGPVEPPETWDERSAALAERLVAITDTLVDDFEAPDLVARLVESCPDLLGAAAAGLLLRDGAGQLNLAASTGEESRLLELFQLQCDQGPCLDSVRDGRQVAVGSLSEAYGRWPDFAPAARSLGFASSYAFPLRLRERTVGALNLFCAEPAALAGPDRRVAQALADAATIALLQHETSHRATRLAGQLQGALDSRVVIEQAKGMLAEHAGTDMEAAFQAIRQYARNRNRRLPEVADAVVGRTLPLDSVLARRRAR